MTSKKDEIKHLKHLHLEYKKKYNSKKQTIDEENKAISEQISINNFNNYLNNELNKHSDTKSEKNIKSSTSKNLHSIPNNSINSNNNNNNIKTNANQITNTNNSISEHIINEDNKKNNSRSAIPLHQINFPVEKKIIMDDEINTQQENYNSSPKNDYDNNDGNITFKAKGVQKVKSYQNDLLFDSKLKNKKLSEYSMFLDEKINDLKKKLNINYNSINIEKMGTFDNRKHNNYILGANSNNLNSINTDSKGYRNVMNNNLENSNLIYKNNINMNMDSFDFNSINMDQPSFGHQIFINNNNINNNTISIKDQNIFHNVKLSLDKFTSISKISLKLNPYIIILSYLNTKDIFQIFQANKKLRELFMQALKLELNMYITSKFKRITKNLFDNYYFYIALNKNLKTKHLKIFLILKSKIISPSLINKSLHIQYFAHFPCDDNQFVQNTFLLDVKEPPIYYWAMKESTNFNEDELNKAYFMNVMQYAVNDYVEFSLNIFTEKGLMDIRKLVWDKITVFKTPNEDFLDYSNENILKREIVDFDMSRYCEMELCKGKWNDIILLENSDNYIADLKNKFKDNFNILKILFDNVGYLIFKFYLEGKKPGVVNADEEIGIKITILSKNENKSNETKKNNLVFDRKNEIQMHIGDVFIFYISKNV